MEPPSYCNAPKREEQGINKEVKLASRMKCMNHEANHIHSSSRTKISWRCLDGVAHLPFGHAIPWHCCGWLTIRQSTTHSPSPPNNPSSPHTILGAPKLVKRNLSATPMNQIKETKYKALRIGNYLHVLLLTQILVAALPFFPPNTNLGEVVSNNLRPNLVPKVLK